MRFKNWLATLITLVSIPNLTITESLQGNLVIVCQLPSAYAYCPAFTAVKYFTAVKDYCKIIGERST